MERLKKYIKSISSILISFAFILAVFYILFKLNNMEMDIYISGLEVSIFLLAVYLIIRYMSFKKELSSEEKITKLAEENEELKNLYRRSKSEILEYFFMWVHQIKTPITAANLLIGMKDINKNEISKQLFYIEDYTNMALSFLKLNEHERDMVFSDVRVGDIIKPILRKFSILFIDNRITLEYEDIDEVIATDAKWFGILVEQIVSNAVKYTKNGTVSIKMIKNGDEKTLEIKDSGIGISEQDLPKIFDRGYSGFNGRMNQKSSGIGLFLAKQIANKIFVDIDVESKVGEGTAFYIKVRNKNI